MRRIAHESTLSNEARIADAFHGMERTDEVLVEKPHHRQAALLFALGAHTGEVAAACDVSPQSVCEWLKQGWFQERITLLMKEHGGRDLTQLFINEAFACLATMVELRDAKTTPAAVKRGVCADILDRGFGKPKVYVETSKATPSDDPVAEAERLMAENAKLIGRS